MLKPAGRMCINVVNTGHKPYRPLSLVVTWIALKLGFLMRGDIIWNKGNERKWLKNWLGFLAYAKQSYSKRLSRVYFSFFKAGVWAEKFSKIINIRDEQKAIYELSQKVSGISMRRISRKVKHPAPFPIELPRRLILLYSFPGDTVLDPFMGSGTTALAALETGRKYVGFEKESDYCKIANERIAAKFAKTA